MPHMHGRKGNTKTPLPLPIQRKKTEKTHKTKGQQFGGNFSHPNCSHRFLGRKLRRLYLVLEILLLQNTPAVISLSFTYTNLFILLLVPHSKTLLRLLLHYFTTTPTTTTELFQSSSSSSTTTSPQHPRPPNYFNPSPSLPQKQACTSNLLILLLLLDIPKT
jgi:hypothetical protein